jgi:CelD/BcsL family acetyltransferase involved in cellulose biosynthesis
VILAEDDNGVAMIPAAIVDGKLTLLGERLFDYRDVLVSGDVSVLDSAWARAAELGLDFSAGALRTDENLKTWQGFVLSEFYGAPLVSYRAKSADAFAAEHSRLGRWKRRLEREGVALRLHSGANSPLIREIYQRKASQPAETGDSLFRDPLRIDFMVQVCAAVGELCEVFTFESAGTLVASLVTFLDRNVRRFYTVQIDPAWARYSPGMVLIYEATCRSLAAGLDCDYMTGEHSYKLRFATEVVPMKWVQASAAMLSGLATRRDIAA